MEEIEAIIDVIDAIMSCHVIFPNKTQDKRLEYLAGKIDVKDDLLLATYLTYYFEQLLQEKDTIRKNARCNDR